MNIAQSAPAKETSQATRPLLMLFVALVTPGTCFCVVMFARPVFATRTLLALLFLTLAVKTILALPVGLFVAASLLAAGARDLAVCTLALLLFAFQVRGAVVCGGSVFATSLPVPY